MSSVRMVCVFAVGIFAGFAILAILIQSKQPRTGGKTVSVWFSEIDPIAPESNSDACNAFRKLGPEALQFLTNEIDKIVSPGLLDRISGAFSSRAQFERLEAVGVALDAIGPSADNVVPFLDQQYRKTQSTLFLDMIARRGAAGKECLIGQIHSSDEVVQLSVLLAIEAWDWRVPEIEDRVVELNYHNELGVRLAALKALSNVNPDEKVMIEVMGTHLSDDDIWLSALDEMVDVGQVNAGICKLIDDTGARNPERAIYCSASKQELNRLAPVVARIRSSSSIGDGCESAILNIFNSEFGMERSNAIARFQRVSQLRIVKELVHRGSATKNVVSRSVELEADVLGFELGPLGSSVATMTIVSE